MTEMTWADHQRYEAGWWGNCHNTFAEEAKQISYAHRMGLVVVPDPTGNERWPIYDAEGKRIVDIGAGPCSLLLKVVNWNRLTVIDPCVYPNWIYDRYQAAGITTLKIKGENIGSVQADETDLAEAGE